MVVVVSYEAAMKLVALSCMPSLYLPPLPTNASYGGAHTCSQDVACCAAALWGLHVRRTLRRHVSHSKLCGHIAHLGGGAQVVGD